jgi:general secretion pathway protein E
MTGYRGRFGIFEMLTVTDPIRKLIAAEGFTLGALQAEAHTEGMKSMFEDGVTKVELAQTTMEEVLRVISE